jgi:UDP-glucose 4-epimerase
VRILVTGAEGFVGQHLRRELSEHEVEAWDIRHADLSKPWTAEEMILTTQPDYVVHLAARYGRLLCADEPHRAVADNAAATVEIAAVCAEQDIPVLYTSSSEVYGDHGEATITEDSELRLPTTIYGLSKRWGEEALALYGVKRCVVRMNMLYGPQQQAGYGRCALATFIENALAGEPITVHRDASRSWLYIQDAVRALRLLIEGGHTGVFNLGNGEERTSMRDLAELVIKAAEYPVPIDIVDAPPGQIRHKNYDSSKLRATIDWKPETPLATGIQRTVEAELGALV